MNRVLKRPPFSTRKRIRPCLALLSAAALASSGRAIPGSPLELKLSNPLQKTVVATHRLVAGPKKPVEDVNCYFFIPQDEPRQKIEALQFIPKPDSIGTDKYGRKVARWHIRRIPAGGHVAVRWAALVTTYDMKAQIHTQLRSRRVKITDELRELYLVDKSLYNLQSATIRNIADEIVSANHTPYKRVRAICAYLKEHLAYELVDVWDTAAKTLPRGTGSCSEYAFAFIALCRAAGVPARYVGATKCPSAAGSRFDTTNHRWPEAFLEGYGWVQLDPCKSYSVKPGYFAISREYLALGHGDGDTGSLMAWRYTGKAEPRKGLRAREEFFWCDPVAPERFHEIISTVAARNGRAPSPARAVAILGELDSDLALPFLTDILWSDNDGAVARAANLICRIDALCARQIRFFVRHRGGAARAMSRALEATAAGSWPGERGYWRNLFDGRRVIALEGRRGPFAIRDGWLANARGRGTLITDHVTSDRCIIDLRFKVTAPGRAALIFARSENGEFVELPFHVAEEPYLMRNRLLGVPCAGGLYGATPGAVHRATIAIDGCRVRVDFDGKMIFQLYHPKVGPGRIGLTVWGSKTRLHVERLRVMELGRKQTISGVLRDERLMKDE